MITWPELSAERDRPTIVALHLFSQVVGKVPTALLPWRNHGWHLTLHVTPRGLRTEPIHAPGGTFALAFDLADHELVYESATARMSVPLQPMPVADFHHVVMEMIASAGHEIRIHAAPNEVDPAIPFAEDREVRIYDRDSVRRLHGALVQADRVFRLFRSSFLGKVSPVHFFWGSFDLAVTRFSGRRAPAREGADAMTREAYSHEVSSVGFWPGDGDRLKVASFYSYAAPEPQGFRDAIVRPPATHYNEPLGGFYLHYDDDFRTAATPEQTLLEFCRSTYEPAAALGKWDRAALERES
jgi:hypothetical protein